MSDGQQAAERLEDVKCAFDCGASNAKWAVVTASVTEERNQPYELSVSLRTDEVDADPTEMLGQSCTLVFQRGDLTNPYPGIIHRIDDPSTGDRLMQVSVLASAALWLLSQNRQTRIFQEMTVPEILDKVLGDGLSAYDRKHETDLTREYPKCEYRVQYDESDWAFCERLMEEEGIIYWFKRDDSTEVVFLTDDPLASRDVESIDGDKDVAFSGDTDAREYIERFRRSSSMRPTKLSTRHFNWTLPSLPIENEEEGAGEDGAALGPVRETYQHDLLPPTLHGYTDDDGYEKNDAKVQCQVRRELGARDKIIMRGDSSVIGFSAGGAFNLIGHSLEGEYVLTAVNHSCSSRAGSYSNTFTCIPADTPYRPDRGTRKPRVLGLETATVVGPSDQEIHTDKHGRIKVQFHWDREGENDDHSSCFIRVVQPWAGAGWGFVFIPRIGMEVTVAFVQGDPDRPIVTGCVYNGENLTPYEMPDEMTKSTIRTQSSPQSSPGGDAYNELSFEDKEGEEEVFLQAQKNLRELVKNDHATEVQNDQTLDVTGNQGTTVGKDQTVDVAGNQTTTVEKDQTLDVTGNQTTTIGTDTASAVQTITVHGDKIEDVKKGNFDQTVDEDFNQTILGNTVEDVKKDRTCLVGETWTTDAGKDVTITASNVGTIDIKEELTIKVGDASITMKKNGDIKIKGGKIDIIGSGKIKVDGKSDVEIKGSQTKIN